MASKKLMIIDTDCGIDDALAIVMALSHPKEWEVLAITCVSGNTDIDNVCQNVLRVLHHCNAENVKVYKGCEKAIVSNDFRASHHKEDGFGGVATEFSTGGLTIQNDHASNVLVELAKKYPQQITLVALGPLTNLALSQRLDANFTQNLQQLIIMGGNIDARGNILKCCEFNFAYDPEAAHMMLTETLCSLLIVPWETCFRNAVPWDWYDKWVQTDTPKGQLLRQITAEASNRLRNTLGRPAFCCCDLLAMAVVINPNVIKKKIKRHVEIELHGQHTRGMMLVERRPLKLAECSSYVDIVKELDITELNVMYIDMLQ